MLSPVCEQRPPWGRGAAADVDPGGRPREETVAIREWATANGLEVSARGRISTTVLAAYENRRSTTATTNTAAAPVVEFVDASVIGAEAKPKRRTRKKAVAEGCRRTSRGARTEG